MPRTAIPVQELPALGDLGIDTVTWTPADAVNHHEFQNTGRELLIARNRDVAAKTVTVKGVADPYGRTLDTVLTVPAESGDSDGVSIAGTFKPPLFSQGATGLVNVDVSAATTLDLAVIRIPVQT